MTWEGSRPRMSKPELTASELLGKRRPSTVPPQQLDLTHPFAPRPEAAAGQARLLPPLKGVEQFVLKRAAFEDEFTVELGGNSFLMTVQETLIWMTQVLRYGRDPRFEAEQIADYVWNLREATVSTASGLLLNRKD